MQPASNRCHSILVVEDDMDIRESIVDLLESEGYATHSAANGMEALHLLQDIEHPCLVLLDMMMPIMNGREFLDQVKKDTILAPIPILVVSAVADRTDTHGSVGYLKKPIDIEMFLRLVEKYCA